MSSEVRLENQENIEKPRTIERIKSALVNLSDFLKDIDIANPNELGTTIEPKAKEFEMLINELYNSIQVFNDHSGELLDVLLEQDISEINNQFYRIKGLVDHDIKKSFTWHTGYLAMIQYIMDDGIIAPEEYEFLSKCLRTIYWAIPESLNILELLSKYRNNAPSLSLDSLPNAIGFGSNGSTNTREKTYTYIDTENNRTNIHLNRDIQIEMPETLFTVSTLILNAKGERAKDIDILIKEYEDSLEITILDNATEGIFPEEYIEDISASFKSGMRNPYKPLQGSSGGGKLAAFLAGQRYALAHPLADIDYYSDEFTIIEGEIDGLKAKGFKITLNREGMFMPLSLKALNYELTRIDYIAKLLNEGELNGEMEFVGNYIYSFKNNMKNPDSFLNLILASYPDNKILNNITENINQKFEELLNPLVEQIMRGMVINSDNLNTFINFVYSLVNFGANPEDDNLVKLNEFLRLPDKDLKAA